MKRVGTNSDRNCQFKTKCGFERLVVLFFLHIGLYLVSHSEHASNFELLSYTFEEFRDELFYIVWRRFAVRNCKSSIPKCLSDIHSADAPQCYHLDQLNELVHSHDNVLEAAPALGSGSKMSTVTDFSV